MQIFVLFITVGIILILLAHKIDGLENRLKELEQKPYHCAKGIAVMIPEGYATIVCAP